MVSATYRTTSSSNLSALGMGDMFAVTNNYGKGGKNFYNPLEYQDKENEVDSLCSTLAKNPILLNSTFTNQNHLLSILNKLNLTVLGSATKAIDVVELGIIVCLLESLYEIISCKRSYFFSKKKIFEFDDLLKLISSNNKGDKVLFLEKLLKYLNDVKTEYVDLDIENLKNQIFILKQNILKFPDVFSNSEQFNKIVCNLYKEKIKTLKNEYFSLNQNDLLEIKKNKTKYFNENLLKKQTLENKKNKLARRVNYWMVLKTENKIPKILNKLSSANRDMREKGIRQSGKLLKNLKIQNKKNMISHAIGLVAVGILIPLGLVLSLYFHMTTAAYFCIGLGILISIVRYTFTKGYRDTEGWDFSFKNVFPGWMYNLYIKIK